MYKILIFEGDSPISNSMKLNLHLDGYRTEEIQTTQEAWGLLCHHHYDLVCLSMLHQNESGLKLCQKIRDSGNDIPILFISTFVDETTVLKGIASGADDFLRTPFGIEELKLRIKRLIRHHPAAVAPITVGSLSIDPAKKIASIMGKAISLGRKELEILVLLAKRAGDIVSRENILYSIYESAELYDRTIDSHVSHLRKKLKEVAGERIKILSVYGLGYRLQCT